jgi:histidyl-tRNA synthetase
MAENRLSARLPRGFQDIPAATARARHAMIETVRSVYDRFGFEPLETPAIEFVDTLGKFLPEQDRPDEGIFAFQDNDEQWMALRYDLTAPLARFVAQQGQNLPLPFRRYQVGQVWRNEKPGPGRFREFTQFDADTVGAASSAADAENVIVLAEALEALGIGRGEYIIRVNTRRVLDGVMESIGLKPGSDDPVSLAVLRAIDKFDRFGFDGVRLLLTTGRKDESGDFTKGAGLDAKSAEAVLAFMRAGQKTRGGTVEALASLVAKSQVGQTGITELTTIDSLLSAAGVDEARAIFDPGIVRGLAYYTGPVLEAGLTFDILDDEGRPRQIGSIASGGRYDGLVSRFTGSAIPATGVSIGVDRLLAALMMADRLSHSLTQGPVLVTVFDRARLADYQKIAAELRASGVRAQVYLGESGLKAQLKYADRHNAPVAVIAGEDEFKAGTVSLKNLALGAELAKGIKEHSEWRDKSTAQVTVPRAELVARVKEMLKGS